MPGILCEHCVGYCCRYIALPIETPTERSDFDDIRWYLLHEGITVFVEDGEWFLLMSTTCRHLQPDFRCGIYETRPQICRDYSTDNCDYHSGDYGWEQHFACAEHLDDYVRARFAAPGARSENGARAPAAKTKSRKGRRRPRLKARLHPRRAPSPEQRYLDARTDIRGVPLPVLPSPPA